MTTLKNAFLSLVVSIVADIVAAILTLALLSGVKTWKNWAKNHIHDWASTQGWRGLASYKVQPVYAGVLGVRTCAYCSYALEPDEKPHGYCLAHIWAGLTSNYLLIRTYDQMPADFAGKMYDEKNNISWSDVKAAIETEFSRRNLFEGYDK